MQSDLLDIVIGVVFVWLLLSMVLSALNEGFSLLTHARAKHLWLGIGRIFDPSKSPLPRRLLDVAYTLPFSGKLDLRPRTDAPEPADGQRGLPLSPVRWTDRPTKKLDPALLPVRTKNEVLYQSLAPQLTELARPGRLSKVTHVAAEAFSEAMLKLACNVHAADLKASAAELESAPERRQWLETALAQTPAEKALPLEEVTALAGDDSGREEWLRALYNHASHRLSGRDVADLFTDNPELAKAVKQAAIAVGTNERVVAVRGVIESWFERTMGQLSTFYRRQTRKILGLLAVPLVLFTHANSIAIFEDLRNDTSLRQAALAAAGTVTEDNIDAICPASSAEAPAGSTTTTTDSVTAASDRLRCARDVVDQATEFRVGLAWQELKAASGDKGADADFEVDDVLPYLEGALTRQWGWLGRLITLVALLFGAQFWFDLLRRLVGARRVLAGGKGGTTAG